MKVKIIPTPKFKRQLAKLDKFTQKQIISWLNKNLGKSDNPKIHEKALVGNHANQWRYRIGDYRVIVNINDQKLIVLALEIGHRRKIY
jgi:mRNA interferase RelE/StbE